MSIASLKSLPDGPNVKTMTYTVQTRKTEDGKEEYRFVDGDGNHFGRVFDRQEEAPEVIREWLRNQPAPRPDILWQTK